MKLQELSESYSPGLFIPLPAIVRSAGIASVLKDLADSKGAVKEMPLKKSLYLLYTGKKPSRNEVATMLQNRFNIPFEQALKLIPGE